MSSNKKPVVACVGGRSGGHIVPALSLARQEFPHHEVVFFSTATQMDKEVLHGRSLAASYFLPLSDFPRKKLWRYPLFIIQCIAVFVMSFWQLAKWQPRALISMGGYISIPVVCAAKILRIPVSIYELNAQPGLAVIVLARFNKKVFYCLDETKKYLPATAERANYPLRYEEKDIIDAPLARQKLGLIVHKPTLLILGGSQGSRFINQLIMGFIKEDPQLAHRYSIIHQTGKEDEVTMQEFYKNHGIHAYVFSFRPNMADVYCAADVAITRAGAGSLFELSFFQKPALIIPLNVGTTGHQVDNAHAMRIACPHLFQVLLQKDIVEDPELFKAWLMRADKQFTPHFHQANL